MKTQFIVTITQTGDDAHKAAPSVLERNLREVVRDAFNNDNTTVTVRHMTEDTEPAADTLEALVREYSTAPTTGKGRVRANVLEDIRAMFGNPGSQVAPNSAKPSVPVEEAVATLNAATNKGETITADRKAVHGAIFDAHRAGQSIGRVLPKEGRERAGAFADNAVAVLTK